MPVFMLVIMIYLANATVNQHFHQLDSGMMIKHAHPFENKKPDNPFEKHHHTSSELVLLDQISSNAFWIYLYILLVSSVFLYLFSLHNQGYVRFQASRPLLSEELSRSP
jgi:hypothetical protein